MTLSTALQGILAHAYQLRDEAVAQRDALADAVEDLANEAAAREAEHHADAEHDPYFEGVRDVWDAVENRCRAVLNDTGASERLAQRDARVKADALRRALRVAEDVAFADTDYRKGASAVGAVLHGDLVRLAAEGGER